MRLSETKIDIALARTGTEIKDLERSGVISRSALAKIRNGGECKPVTAGKLAKALQCDVTELLKQEE